MEIIDLTHVIEENMPVYPGTETPILYPACTYEAMGFREIKMTMYSHTGTHMDAPAHMLEEGKTLDQLPIDHFIGQACVIDVRHFSGEIPVEVLKPYKEGIQASDFVLLMTGWSDKWGTEDYFKGFPALSSEAAYYLAGFSLKGFGVDAISVDLMDSKDFQVHKILLQKNMVFIENLKNLSQLPSQGFTLSVLPLKTIHADGSPVRAVAMK